MPLRISYHVTKKAVALCKHVERNGKDKDAEFGLYSDQEPSSLDDPILRRNKFPLLLPAPPPPQIQVIHSLCPGGINVSMYSSNKIIV